MDEETSRLAAETERLRDEVERLRAEVERLREASHRGAGDALAQDLAAAIQGLPILVFLFDGEDRYVDYRAGRATDLYVAPPAFVGKRVDEVLPAPLGAQFRDVMARVRAGRQEELVEYHLDMPSGRQEFEARVIPLAGDRVAVLVTDVTERRRRDELLRESEERFRLAFENAPIGMALVGLDERLLDVNAALCAMLGHPRERLLGLTVPQITDPDDVAAEQRHKEALAGGGRSSYRMEKRYVHADGHRVWGELSVTAIAGPDGTPRCFLGQVEDLTERKLAEERLRASEQRVREAQKLESIGRLAGGVAHDFNNILTVILSCAEQLESDLSLPGAWADEVREIRAAAERARDLTRQLLAFARRQVIAPVALDLNALVRESLKLLRRLLREDVQVSVSLAPDLWTVRCDPAQLQQVIVNLAVNARDAMPRGGRLELETRNERVEPEQEGRVGVASGEYVVLAVADSGEGMTDDARSHVFEPFFTTKAPGRGTGLGLATVYGIVRQSGGEVRVETEPGRGTRFEIHLPRAEAAPAPAPAEAPRPAPRPGGDEMVLVLEDDPRVREMTVRALRGGGYRVIEAGRARDALALVAGGAPELRLLVTDVVMPEMSGRDAAEALQRSVPGLRVLYVSGYAQHVIAHRGVLDPGVEFLAKPFTASTLLLRVRELLDRR